ncbi:hypothetical protein KAS42_04490 [bacterium]|nr:hypothetical protein [bacterium]
MKNFIKSYWWKLLLLIIIWFICYTINITLSQEHLFWTFSTVMQSFVALGALLGMVAVFRLQIINNKSDIIALSLRKPIIYFRGMPASTYLPEDILCEGNKILKEEGNKVGSEIKLGLPQLEKLFDEEKNIKKQIVDFVKKIVVITALALIFLIITPTLIKIHADIASLGLILYLAITSLITTIKLIKEIL